MATRPDLSPDEVMEILVVSASPMTTPLEEAGAGYLNAEAAFAWAKSAPGNLEDFLACNYRYGGPDSGDPTYGRDATTYQPERRPETDPAVDSTSTAQARPEPSSTGANGNPRNLGTEQWDSSYEGSDKPRSSPGADWLMIPALVALALYYRRL